MGGGTGHTHIRKSMRTPPFDIPHICGVFYANVHEKPQANTNCVPYAQRYGRKPKAFIARICKQSLIKLQNNSTKNNTKEKHMMIIQGREKFSKIPNTKGSQVLAALKRNYDFLAFVFFFRPDIVCFFCTPPRYKHKTMVWNE